MTAPSVEPDGAPRIATLDILRGIAILGILFMNISDMGGSLNGPDPRHLGWSGADQATWWLRQVLADGTARGLLELLFGAGMVILTERLGAAADEGTVLRHYYWRNLVLLGFGFIHIFVLLWPGDILHTYAVAAMIAVLFRNLRPRLLIMVGLAAACWQTALIAPATYTALTDHSVAVETRRVEGIENARTDTARVVAEEDRLRSTSTAGWVAAAFGTATDRMTDAELWNIWEAAGTMLIGAALFRLGVLQGKRGRSFYARLTVGGYGLAGGWRALGAWQVSHFDDAVQWHWALDELARLGMTLGHLGLICLLLGTGPGTRVLGPFAAAGRAALTIYVLQTLIGLWLLFPPWGIALYGKLSWAQLMPLAAATDAMLLAFAVAYMKRFRIAPVEWAWRSLVEGRRLAFRR